MLSDSDSEGSVDNVQLTINEHYAKAYAYKKEREELAKLKEKYGSDVDEDEGDEEDSEDDETEDEDGEELTPAVDAAILRTLARIKRKDPDIYNTNKDVFEEEQRKTKQPAPTTRKSTYDTSKPLLLRQHKIKSALEGNSSDDDDDTDAKAEPLTHTAEQAALRKETISAFHGAVDTKSEDEEDDLLVPREKTKDELEREEEEYREFLEREVGEDIGALVTLEGEDDLEREGDMGVSLEEVPEERKESKKSKKSQKRKQESDHEFLMNYILNRGWVDKSSRHIPTYNEVTRGKKGSKAKKVDNEEQREYSEQDGDNADDGGSSQSDFDEEEFDDVVDSFEQSYNFRFEEPDAASITTHPRDIASTVRRTDTTRKEARERKKQRKEDELLKRKEEVKRLKALKMKEVREKLERVRREGGRSVREDALDQLDLEGDWDPDAHDKQMADIYAGEGDDEEYIDSEKPTWDDDIDITDIVPPSPKLTSSKSNQKNQSDEEDIGVDIDEMDADAVRSSSKKRKRPQTEEERAALDALDSLDFTSLTGGIPTRFKYAPVLPDNFGLTPVEILLADDAELNEYIGLRRLAPYRKDADAKGKGAWDKGRGERLKEFRMKMKDKWGDLGGSGNSRGSMVGGTMGEQSERPAKKRKGKKERMKEKAAAAVTENGDGEIKVEHKDSAVCEDAEDEDHGKETDQNNTKSPKKRRRKRKKGAADATST